MGIVLRASHLDRTSAHRASRGRPPRGRLARAPWAVSLASAVLLTSAPAIAFERQWRAGVDLGYAVTHFGSESPATGGSGLGGGVHAAYGFSDAVNGLVELSYSRSAGTNVWSAAAGAAYALDILRLVPYGGALVGVYQLGGRASTTAPGGQLALGLDYSLSRDLAVGVEGRLHCVLASDPVGAFPYATVFLRAEYVWGF